jgi:hypothetical protein
VSVPGIADECARGRMRVQDPCATILTGQARQEGGGTGQGELLCLPERLPDQLPQSHTPNRCHPAGRYGRVGVPAR